MRRYFLILSLLAGVIAFGSAPAFADEHGNGYDNRGAKEFHAPDTRGSWGQAGFGGGDTFGRAHDRRDERNFQKKGWQHRRFEERRMKDRGGRNDRRDGYRN